MLLQFEDFLFLFDLFPLSLFSSAATLSCRLTLNKLYIAMRRSLSRNFRALPRRLLGGTLPISRLYVFSLYRYCTFAVWISKLSVLIWSPRKTTIFRALLVLLFRESISHAPQREWKTDWYSTLHYTSVVMKHAKIEIENKTLFVQTETEWMER